VRIARFAKGDGVAYGVVEGESGQPQTVAELHGHPFGIDPAGVRFTGERYPLAEVRLLAPVLPSKVVAVGKNYAEHVREMGKLFGDGEQLPAEPVLFLKPSTSVIGHGSAIAYPVKLTDRVDFEGELAVIIGRLCRDVPRERAEDVVFGYSCANDVTARDLHARDGQWTRAKAFDTFCPLGPWMETGTDPADLGITTTVNGDVRQHAHVRAAVGRAVADRVRVVRDDPAPRRRAAHRNAGGRRTAHRRRRGVGDDRVDRHVDQQGRHPRLTRLGRFGREVLPQVAQLAFGVHMRHVVPAEWIDRDVLVRRAYLVERGEHRRRRADVIHQAGAD